MFAYRRLLKSARRHRFFMEGLEPRLALSAVHDYVLPFYQPATQTLVQRGDLLSAARAGAPLTIAQEYLQTNATRLGVSASDIASSEITDHYTDADSGVTHIYLRQTYEDLAIKNALLNINVTAAGEVINVGSTFVNLVSSDNKGDAASVSSLDALLSAAAALELAPSATPSLVSTGHLPGDVNYVFAAPSLSRDPIPAKQAYLATPEGLELTWEFVLNVPRGEHWYDVSVDASSSELIQGVDWVSHASYNVLGQPSESPDDGPRVNLTNPQDTAFSPFGWHDTNGVAGAEFTDTRGNNVFAQEDRDNNNTGGLRPDGGAGLNFNFPLDLTQDPLVYESAAITNLFYWNNILHDVHAAFGFTEAAGNFQFTNYGGLGLGNDAVQADSLDGSGTNNANFGTPPDGFAPRMQMFRFTITTPNRDSSLDNGIIVHEYGHGVSNRLTGGPANSGALNAIQSGGMGEGWSDFWGLMFTQVATDQPNQAYPIGTYVLDNTAGIRRNPYSFDMVVNPITWDAFNSSQQVHNVGEIWASTLWDLNWLLVAKHGFDADLSTGYTGTGAGAAGNKLTLQLVTDALKLQPANPSFIDARDAILLADEVLTGGDSYNEIWQAFARRGLGVDAATASSSSTVLTTSFEAPEPLQDETFSLAENSPVNTVVGTLQGNDPDNPSNTLTYSLSGTSVFAVNSSTGAIRVTNAAAMDFETTPSFTFTATLRSNGVEIDTATITVNLTNVDDPLVLNSATFGVDENSANGTVVGTVTATDQDGAPSEVTYDSTDVPITILDVNTVTSTNIVSGAVGSTLDVNVQINLNHTFDGDLELVLISPAGTRISLSNNRGGGGDNFTDTIFDDEAATAIASGTAPFTGSFRPEELLSALDGVSPNGTWTLEISDTAGADVGVLNSWSLEISTNFVATTSYSLSGTSAFAINAATGQITVANAAALDFESTPSFIFTATADDGVSSDSGQVTVNLVNVNEVPTISLTNTVTTLPENTNTNAALRVADVELSDNLGNNVFSVTGSDANLFEVVSGQLRIKAGTVLNFDTNPVLNVTVNVNDSTIGGPLDDSADLEITVTDVAQNAKPLIGFSSTPATFAENAPALVIVSGAVVSDSDTPVFNGGRLTVSIISGLGDTDILAVRNQGSGAGQIDVVGGTTVRFGGATFGTISGGTAGVPLRISFTSNGNASQEAVQALVRNILFRASGDNPSTTQRQVRFVVNDGPVPGAGATSLGRVKLVNVIAINDRPVMSFGGSRPYRENSPAVQITNSATVNDVDDTNFGGGSLTVAMTTGAQTTDVLSVLAIGNITVSGNTVSHSGTPIGTLSGGTHPNPLVISLNANATIPRTQALVRAIGYRSTSENPAAGNHVVRFILDDGTTPSFARTRTMVVTPVNDAPRITTGGGTVGYVRNAAALTLLPAAAVIEDQPNFNTGKLRVTHTGAHAIDRVLILGAFTVEAGTNKVFLGSIATGTHIGTRNINGVGTNALEVTLNGNATTAIVQQLVRSIRFRTDGSNAGSIGNREFSFRLTDTLGLLGNIATKNVNVT